MLSLYTLNQKGMMHRDIKCENILLKSEKFGNEEHIVAKMSDLGLSRKIEGVSGNLTTCGTPYYVSPEIAAGEKKYNYNSDVWSLGVMLYELVTLNKPWYDPNLRTQELFNLIFTTPYPPLPKGTDERIKLLIKEMLMKDPNRRITLDDLFKIDFIYEKTIALLKTFKWDEVPEFKGIFNYEKEVSSHYRFMSIVPNEDIETLREGIRISYSSIPFEYKAGFFGGTIKNAIKGDEVYEEISKAPETEDDNDKDSQIEALLTKLLSKKILLPISHSLGNVNSFINDYLNNPSKYVFKMSTDSFDSNANAIDNKPIYEYDITKEMDYIKLSQYLIYIGKKVYKQISKSRETDNDNISYEIQRSPFYLTFLCGIAYFQNCDIMALPYTDTTKARELFLLNIFQIMSIHSYINAYLNQKKIKSSSLLSYFQYESGVNYQFKNMTLNDLELKHVVFRGNKPVPGSYMRMVYNSDVKCQLLPNYSKVDVLMYLFNGSDAKEGDDSKMKFCVFKERCFDEQFEELIINLIIENITIEEDEEANEKELSIVESLKDMMNDFGEKDDKGRPKGFFEFLKGYIAKVRTFMNTYPYKMEIDSDKFAALEVICSMDIGDVGISFYKTMDKVE